MDSTLMVAAESWLNTCRVIIEFYQTEPCNQCYNILTFAFFILSASLNVYHPDVSGFWADAVIWLPTIAGVVELCAVELYAYASVLFFLSILLTPLRIDLLMILIFGAQLRVRTKRSNILRTAAIASLLFSCVTHSSTLKRLSAIVANELGTWATERYMVPWRIRGSKTACCNFSTRFAIGFFIGVHITAGTGVYLRPNPRWLAETVKGIAVHDGRAYLRYNTNPLGILLAYVEGLQLLPFTLVVRDDTFVDVSFFWSDRVYSIDLREWAVADEDLAFSAASRFPFRRVLAGLAIRLYY